MVSLCNNTVVQLYYQDCQKIFGSFKPFIHKVLIQGVVESHEDNVSSAKKKQKKQPKSS